MWSILFDSLYFDRVNSAFLDNLEGRSRGSEKEIKEEGDWENPYLVPEDLRQQPSDPPGQLNPEPEQSSYDWTQEVGEHQLFLTLF